MWTNNPTPRLLNQQGLNYKEFSIHTRDITLFDLCSCYILATVIWSSQILSAGRVLSLCQFFFISARYWSFIYIFFFFFSSFIIFNCCLRWLFKKDHPLLSGPGNEDTGSLFIVTSLGVTSLPWVNVKNKRRLLLDISYLVHWMFCYHFEYFACCFSQFWHAYCT